MYGTTDRQNTEFNKILTLLAHVYSRDYPLLTSLVYTCKSTLHLTLGVYARNGALAIVKQPNRYSKLFTAYSHNNKRSVPVVRVVPDLQ